MLKPSALTTQRSALYRLLNQTNLFPISGAKKVKPVIFKRPPFESTLPNHQRCFSDSETLLDQQLRLRSGPRTRIPQSKMNPQMKQIMEELKKTKKELVLATEAEEKSRKAMDELASVLQQVAAEATEAKQELKATKQEKEQIRLKLKYTDERLASIMAECNEFKNVAERLRLEVDDTLANWNVKESGLVGCIKKVEEERSRAQAENSALQEEMKKLRDILKQAMMEAISAKEDAGLAKRENSELKVQLAEKDTALNYISRELESLRASEAAARCSLHDLNLQLAVSSTSLPGHIAEKQEEIKPQRVPKKTFSFGLGCSGRSKRLEDLVGEKANKVVARGDSNLNRSIARDAGTSSLPGTRSCRFPDEARISRDNEHDASLRKKALSRRFGGAFK